VIWAAGQRQVEAEQVAPVAQATPQAPQWAGSVARSKQATPPSLPHSRFGEAQAHVPWAHTWELPQAVAQLPQWAGSLASATQRVPHTVAWAAGQVQPPAWQVWLVAGHAWPQALQFRGSDWRSVQVLAQTLGLAAGQAHWPASQSSPPTVQAVAQPPQ
jgi:hypothetical protein